MAVDGTDRTMADDAGDEQQLIEALSKALLHDTIEGLDDDLVAYMAGMLHAAAADDPEDLFGTVDEVLTPFLESVACPEAKQNQARTAALQVLQHGAIGDAGVATTASSSAVRKLHQGVVNMAGDLHKQSQSEAEANAYLWGTTDGVKAAANILIDAHTDKSSAKDKRKLRQADAAKARKALSSQADQDTDIQDGNNIGLVKMNYKVYDAALGTDKKKDVNVKNVTVSLDNGTVLLEHSDLKFAYQRRYGLIGENGVGKSTLLKAIARGEDNGGVAGFPSHLRVLHVRQEVPTQITNDLTVTEAVLKSDMERNALLQLEQELVAKLESGESTGATETLTFEEKRKKLSEKATGAEMQQLRADLKRLDEVYARLQVLNADAAESRAAMILSGLQFTPEMQHAKMSSLSGGWRMRVALAAALFISPDICMLDEPTNHLDLEAVVWLSSYLQTYANTLIVVSHDRDFLNDVCTDVIEFKRRRLTYYRGNFDTYVKLRDESIRNTMRQYQAYQSKREHMMDFIDKFRANAKRATMVQSRIKAVEKMDAEAPEPVEVDPVWRFSIPNSEPLGPPIIAVNDVNFDYNPVLPDGTKKPKTQYLLQDVNFGISLTSKIAILGANGQGKTTLLNLIMGKLRPVSGDVSINNNLRIGHFTQHSADNFDLKLSALENMLMKFEESEDQEMRSFLGRFQIQANDALKPMMLLSGGQKARVAFAALAYTKPHVLVIDEGSNHLSMEAVDALVEAVQDFKGGVLVVSHDAFFVGNTCSELWVVEGGPVRRFRGDFNEYKEYTAKMTDKRVEQSLKRLNNAGT